MTLYKCSECQWEEEADPVNPLDPIFDKIEEHENEFPDHEVVRS